MTSHVTSHMSHDVRPPRRSQHRSDDSELVSWTAIAPGHSVHMRVTSLSDHVTGYDVISCDTTESRLVMGSVGHLAGNRYDARPTSSERHASIALISPTDDAASLLDQHQYQQLWLHGAVSVTTAAAGQHDHVTHTLGYVPYKPHLTTHITGEAGA